MLKLSIILTTALVSSGVFASTMTCHSDDRRTVLDITTPDGGPHVIATVYLIVSGDTYIRDGRMPPDQVVNRATYVLSDEVRHLEAHPWGTDWEVSTYGQDLVVKTLGEEGDEIYRGPVSCTAFRYVGIPRP